MLATSGIETSVSLLYNPSQYLCNTYAHALEPTPHSTTSGAEGRSDGVYGGGPFNGVSCPLQRMYITVTYKK